MTASIFWQASWSKMSATNILSVLQRALLTTITLLVVLHSIETCCGGEPLDGFDEFAAKALKAFGTPGMSVAVVQNGKVAFAHGYGRRNLGDDAAVDARTVFHIASISKTFTATAIAILVDEGKLAWDDPVIKYVPEFQLADPYRTHEATVADLLTHRLGIENDALVPARGDIDRHESIRRMRFLRPVAGFRSKYIYQDAAFVVLSEVVRSASGQTWEDFVKQRIFRPLGMSSSSLEINARDNLSNLATMYAQIHGKLEVDTRFVNGDPHPPWHQFAECAAPEGGVHASAEDMARYLAMYVGRGEVDGVRILKSPTVDAMFALRNSMPITEGGSNKLSYPKMFWGGGLGWQVRDYRSRKQVLHPGSAGSVIVLMPDDNLGVVVLSNRAGLGLPVMVAYELVDRYSGLPPTATIDDWIADVITKPQEAEDERWHRYISARKTDTAPLLPLAEYTGKYACDLYGTATVRQKGTGLVLELGPNFHIPLIHWQDDVFHAEFPMRWRMEWLVKFSEISGGRAGQFDAEQILANEPPRTFRRVQKPVSTHQ
jgi:CubicO group peptidase (beta-lactamase class C family)